MPSEEARVDTADRALAPIAAAALPAWDLAAEAEAGAVVVVVGGEDRRPRLLIGITGAQNEINIGK